MKAHIPAADHRWYCGPHALAVMTGADFESVRSAINAARRLPHDTGVRGVSYDVMEIAAKRLGKELVPKPFFKGCTLKEWLNGKHSSVKRRPGSLYLVAVTGHYVTVIDDWFIDHHTRGKVDVAFAPRLRAKVKAVWRVYHY